jgi:hypothetical protein
MKINGFEYTTQEVFEALQAKGYEIEAKSFDGFDDTFPGGREYMQLEEYCAIKPGENCTEKNQWENVAIREFQKDFVKPPLI